MDLNWSSIVACTAPRNRSICLFDISTPTSTPLFSIPNSHRSLSWDLSLVRGSPGVIVISSNDPMVSLFDLTQDSRSAIMKYCGHTSNVNDVASFENRVFSSSIDRTVKVWNRSSGDLLHSFEDHSDSVYAVMVVGNETTTSSTTSTTGSDSGSGTPLLEERGTTTSTKSGNSPFSPFLVSGSEDTTVRLFDLTKLVPVGILRGHSGVVLQVAFGQSSTSSDTNSTVTANSSGPGPGTGVIFSASDDRSMRIWSVRDLRGIGEVPHDGARVKAVCACGNKVFTGDSAGFIRMIDRRKIGKECVWKVVTHLHGHYEESSETPRRTAPQKHGLSVRRIRIVDDERGVSCGEDGCVRMWRLSDGSLMHCWKNLGGAVYGLAFLGDWPTSRQNKGVLGERRNDETEELRISGLLQHGQSDGNVGLLNVRIITKDGRELKAWKSLLVGASEEDVIHIDEVFKYVTEDTFQRVILGCDDLVQSVFLAPESSLSVIADKIAEYYRLFRAIGDYERAFVVCTLLDQIEIRGGDDLRSLLGVFRAQRTSFATKKEAAGGRNRSMLLRVESDQFAREITLPLPEDHFNSGFCMALMNIFQRQEQTIRENGRLFALFDRAGVIQLFPDFRERSIARHREFAEVFRYGEDEARICRVDRIDDRGRARLRRNVQSLQQMRNDDDDWIRKVPMSFYDVFKRRIQWLFNTKQHCNLVIDTPIGEAFRVHQEVLFLRSSFFHTMMCDGGEQGRDLKTTGSVLVEADADVMRTILFGLYFHDVSSDDLGMLFRCLCFADSFRENVLFGKLLEAICRTAKAESTRQTLEETLVRIGHHLASPKLERQVAQSLSEIISRTRLRKLVMKSLALHRSESAFERQESVLRRLEEDNRRQSEELARLLASARKVALLEEEFQELKERASAFLGREKGEGDEGGGGESDSEGSVDGDQAEEL